MGLGEKCLQAQKQGQGHVLLACRNTGNASTLFEKARGTRIRGRFGSINAHAEKKDLTSGELGTRRKSRIPTTATAANVEVPQSEEAQVYVHDLRRALLFI